MAIHMGRWDCQFCGHKGNLGPEQKCSSCGKPRGENVKFYLPDDAPEVTSAEEIARAKAGADWVCDYCGASNKVDTQRCQGCGNEKTQTDLPLPTRSIPLNQETPNSSGVISHQIPVKKPKSRVGWGIVILFIIGLIWILVPKRIDLSVVGHEWKRTIAIENYRLVQHEDWSVPPAGKMINSFRAIHHYNKVFDHYETRTRTVQVKVGEERYVSGKRDLGNGYFEDEYSTRPIYEDREEEYQEKIYRNEPVYQTKYRYRIYEWTVDRTAVAAGRDHNPNWPQGAQGGKEWRNGAKAEMYTVILKDKRGNEYKVNTDYDYWNRLGPGEKVQGKKKWGTVELPGNPEKE
ncbi:MAG TPA: hypothetical protein VHY08_14410 [Bacillota bacterium]|nr:hypothetical protein [Bacillota bacterium]